MMIADGERAATAAAGPEAAPPFRALIQLEVCQP
jgi:hypothetical protein